MADRYTTEGAKFAAVDRLLDEDASGPKWLRRADLAEAAIRVLYDGQANGFYELISWVIMPNHVHLLIYPRKDLSQIVWGIKRQTARAANRILKRTGAFWERDYFDRWMRDSDGEQRVIRYIENNPVKAGLCSSIHDWPYSSARQRACNARPLFIAPYGV